MNKENKIGFSPEKEEVFLGRLPSDSRRVNLELELQTQLAEDFGIVQFTFKYEFDEDGNIIHTKSREKVMDIMIRGEVDEETESFRKIEQGLKEHPEKTWIHFSPKNKTEKFEYPENCVDFWRIEDGEIIWNRMVVKNNFEEMNEVREFISGEEKVKDEMEILRSPIGVELKLVEIFDLFRLKETKNQIDFEQIEGVVNEYLDEFEDEFGEELTSDRKLIFRLYSACFKSLKYKKYIDLESYMYGRSTGSSTEKSYGCAAETTVGEFGEKIGYYISSDGQVHHGEIPDGYKECKKCGCWYANESCPFC